MSQFTITIFDSDMDHMEKHIDTTEMEDRKLLPSEIMADSTGKVVRAPRTHAQIMESLGYEAPSRPVKKPKGIWDCLLESFPCPPEVQHMMWANRIKRLFKRDCGMPTDWDCECDKCEAALAQDVSAYHEAMNELHEELGVFGGLEVYDLPVPTIELRGVCSGMETSEADTYRVEVPPTVLNVPVIPPGYVHLFRIQEHVHDDQGPHTPFLTILRDLTSPDGPNPPRKMWVFPKTIVPEFLSFK